MSSATRRVAISVAHVTKGFGTSEARTVAVDDVSFDAYFGEMLYVVGPSGSGKTTLLSIISGVLRPDSGTVTLDGSDIWTLDGDALADLRLNRIGFVFQDYHLFPRLTTAENVAIPLILKRQDWDRSIAKAIGYLDVLGLKERADLPPVKLSGGEQQRVAIARAIVGEPKILILDEPTASLDGDSGRRILQFVREKLLDETRCIVVVTHDARILDFANRIMTMEDGRIRDIARGNA